MSIFRFRNTAFERDRDGHSLGTALLNALGESVRAGHGIQFSEADMREGHDEIGPWIDLEVSGAYNRDLRPVADFLKAAGVLVEGQ